MHGWIAEKEYDMEIYFPFKRNACAFSIQAHSGFSREGKKMDSEVTACKSENYLRIPEYIKGSVVLFFFFN